MKLAQFSPREAMGSPPRTEVNGTDAGQTLNEFLRQSGLLTIATLTGGILMTATQITANHFMNPAEYAVWFVLLRIYLLMSIPAVGLQVIFAQRAAAAVTQSQIRGLAKMIRTSISVVACGWLVMTVIVVFWQGYWTSLLKINNPVALCSLVLIALSSLWLPIIRGVLQGRQSFLGLGCVLVLDGAGRFAAVALILYLGGQAAGGMVGVLIGQLLSLAFAGCLIWRLLRLPNGACERRSSLKQIIALTLAIGSIQFLSNADVVYVQSVFPREQTPIYMPAAMVGLALVSLATPLASVMFPKVVRSFAVRQDIGNLRSALITTLLVGGISAVGCTLFPKLPIQLLFFGKPHYWVASPLVPWFLWSLVPLLVANILVSNLLARERFGIVPWTVLIATGYAACLWMIKPQVVQMEGLSGFRLIIQTLGAFSLLLCIVSGWFTWIGHASLSEEPPP